MMSTIAYAAVIALTLPVTLPMPGGGGSDGSSDASFYGQAQGQSITLYGDQYTRVDPPAGPSGSGSGGSGSSGSGSSGSGSSGSGGVVAAYSDPSGGRFPSCEFVGTFTRYKRGGFFKCRFDRASEPEPAPAAVPVVVSARDVASLMVDGSGITRQPPGSTARVDMDLIAYTDPTTRTLSTTVAGTPVEVEATPTSYHWDWGDTTTTTTTSPGAPWPHQTLTHRYHHPQRGVHLTLTTTWTARYRPQDGTWHDVQGTVTTTQQSDTFDLVATTTHLTDHAEHKQGH